MAGNGVALLPALAAAFLLSGCASTTDPALRAFGSLVGPLWSGPTKPAALAGRLSPALTYLYLAEDRGDPVFLALGYVEPSQPPTLVWYSAQQEVLRTRSGRLVGLAGLSAEAFAMRFDHGFPMWSAAPALAPTAAAPAAPAAPSATPHTPPVQATPLAYTRTWDFPNRYRFGLPDRVQLQPRAWQQVPPALLRHVRSQLQSSAYPQWQWFEESSTLMPSAWFALAAVGGQQQVVYSYQCLSAERCFHLAPWPLALTSLP